MQWKQISTVLENNLVFNKKVSPLDIQQGLLKNAYFLSSIAALAERPDRIFRLFNFNTPNSANNSYSVNVLFKGKWKKINLDEYIPVNERKEPAFSSSKQSLWVILL